MYHEIICKLPFLVELDSSTMLENGWFLEENGKLIYDFAYIKHLDQTLDIIFQIDVIKHVIFTNILS